MSYSNSGSPASVFPHQSGGASHLHFADRGCLVQKYPTDSPEVRPRRVLVVDANADSAEVIALNLEVRGHDARSSTSSSAALQLARSFKPEVAVVDIDLPGGAGYTLAMRLRLLPDLEHIRVIASTAYRDKGIGAGPAAHVFRLLEKPIDPTALFAAVEDPGSATQG